VLTLSGLASGAEPPAGLRRIGILYQDPLLITRIEAFQNTLHELGYVEGVTISYDKRMANAGELDAAARALTQSGVDLIVTPGTTGALAVQRSSPQTPLIFYVADPLSIGLVKSLARPGGNATGIASLAAETGMKRLELLKELLPRAGRVTVLSNPDNPITSAQQSAIEEAASKLHIKLRNAAVRRAEDIDGALAMIDPKHSDAFVILPDAVLIARSAKIAQHALKVGAPGIFSYRMFTDAGGLISYGPDFQAVWRQCAIYADKILRGAKPADLPVEQPTKFELVVNLKTAKALGITIPESILLRADEVIR
jgi:putative ABC transport system substrate-binding protein